MLHLVTAPHLCLLQSRQGKEFPRPLRYHFGSLGNSWSPFVMERASLMTLHELLFLSERISLQITIWLVPLKYFLRERHFLITFQHLLVTAWLLSWFIYFFIGLTTTGFTCLFISLFIVCLPHTWSSTKAGTMSFSFPVRNPMLITLSLDIC